MEIKRKYLDRFWLSVDIKGADECWNWLGRCNSTGYGAFRIDGYIQKTAHRVAYYLAVGGISIDAPKDSYARGFLLHKCDNRLCCNPAHLWVGTMAENNRDAKHKGRSRASQGADHPKAKLTWEQAQEIRWLLSEGVSRRICREEFKVSERMVDRIARGESYRCGP